MMTFCFGNTVQYDSGIQQDRRKRRMGNCYIRKPMEIWELWIACRNLILTNTVNSCANCYEDTQEKYRWGWERVIKNVINTKMKFIFEEVTEENHEEYKEGWKCFLQRLCSVPVKFVLEIFQKKIKINTTITDNTSRGCDLNIPRVIFCKMLMKKTIRH